MLLAGRKFAVLLLVLGLVSAGSAQRTAAPALSSGKTAQRRATAPKSRRVPKPAPALPQPPAPPPTPEQMPPVPPQVTYQGGLLTIVATNSMLGDVLSAVRARMGATLETPAGLPTERVAVRLGPGTPRDVLSELFNGSQFDYILVGSGDDPNTIRTIILTPNASHPAPAVAQAPAAQPPATRQLMAPPEQETEDQEGVDEAERPDESPSQPVPPQPQPQPQQQFNPTPPPGTPALPPDVQSNQPPGVQPPGAQPQLKTPEQLLEDLKRLQKMRNQQNPEQGPRI